MNQPINQLCETLTLPLSKFVTIFIFMEKKVDFCWHSPHITLFRFITLFRGTDNIAHNIPHIQTECRV